MKRSINNSVTLCNVEPTEVIRVSLEIIKDQETDESIRDGSLRFLRKPETSSEQVFSIGKETLSRIPRSLRRVTPQTSFNGGWNIFAGSARHGPLIAIEHGLQVYGLWAEDARIGRFLFSITTTTARKYLPGIANTAVVSRNRPRKK